MCLLSTEMDTEASPESAWTLQRALDTEQRVYPLQRYTPFIIIIIIIIPSTLGDAGIRQFTRLMNGETASYMGMCWEQGGDGAASGSRLKRRLWLRLGQRGDGTGLSVRAKRDRRGLLGGPGGLGSVSAPAVPSEKAAVACTTVDAEDRGARPDIHNQLF